MLLRVLLQMCRYHNLYREQGNLMPAHLSADHSFLLHYFANSPARAFSCADIRTITDRLNGCRQAPQATDPPRQFPPSLYWALPKPNDCE